MSFPREQDQQDVVRVCLTCGVKKPIHDFSKKPKSLAGHSRHCKDCMNITARKKFAEKAEEKRARDARAVQAENYRHLVDENKDFQVTRTPTGKGGVIVSFGARARMQPKRENGPRSVTGVQSGMKLFETA